MSTTPRTDPHDTHPDGTGTEPRPAGPAGGDPGGGPARPSLEEVARTVGRRSFATLATASPARRPHVAGILYAAVGTTLYVSTLRSSHKARNVADNPHVAVTVPVRRLPVGPPATVHFQGTAEILELDDPDLGALARSGRIKAVTGHGELDLPGGVFLRITPRRRLVTYGLGMSLRRFIRDPLNAGGHVDLPTG